ncbi:hypothetical protein HDV02_005349 [Globomyces sp. JEL0801]|nr:hypothetical protein HDV02_005349 [Globomyces sp. JEL0801]
MSVELSIASHQRRSSNKGSKQQWPCNYVGCGAILYSKSSQFRHKKLHENKVAKYKCTKCSEQYLVKLDLIDHVRRAHMPAGSYVVCKECDRTFSSLSNLNAHSTIHKDTGLPRYQCEVCQVSYFHRSALRRHQRTDHSMSPSMSRRPSHCSVSTNDSTGFGSPVNHYSYLASPPDTPKLKHNEVQCTYCPETFIDNPKYHFHLEEQHLISSDHRCLINACGEFFYNAKTHQEHKKQCHPFFA